MKQYNRATARIPADVAEWLRQRARQNQRSFNGELVFLLKEKMKVEGDSDGRKQQA